MLILSAQDVSCFGQCSMTVALPILSALGHETPILPTAVLSTHTGGFKGFTFRDLKEDLPSIIAHWKKEGIRFDMVYTGYLGHAQDVDAVLEIASSLNNGPLIVDPAFGDHGRLYGGFDDAYVEGMKGLASKADILLPNLTEACALLGIPYVEKPSEEEIERILDGLLALGPKAVILKGIGEKENETGFIIKNRMGMQRYSHARYPRDSHGTGDIFASIFVGAYALGLPEFDAAKFAADFVYACLKNTGEDPKHTYGVKFEPLLAAFALKVQQAAKERQK